MNSKRFWSCVFALYGILMLCLLFNRAGYQPGVPYFRQLKYNLVPFETILLFLQQLRFTRGGARLHAVVNLAGNVVMFLPLGFCLAAIRPRLRKLWRIAAVSGGIMLLVELTQMLTLVGSFDTDDLILNVLGASLGYGLWKFLQAKTH